MRLALALAAGLGTALLTQGPAHAPGPPCPPAVYQSAPDSMSFNLCADLDTSGVLDTRTDHAGVSQ